MQSQGMHYQTYSSNRNAVTQQTSCSHFFLCSDFLFEAIKSEREGTSRHYLDAAEALALSQVEFFHADNFSMKFAAPILLGASRGQGVGGGESTAHAGGPLGNEEEDEVSSTCLLGKVGLFGLRYKGFAHLHGQHDLWRSIHQVKRQCLLCDA